MATPVCTPLLALPVKPSSDKENACTGDALIPATGIDTDSASELNMLISLALGLGLVSVGVFLLSRKIETRAG
jgi:hypothetical protein